MELVVLTCHLLSGGSACVVEVCVCDVKCLVWKWYVLCCVVVFREGMMGGGRGIFVTTLLHLLLYIVVTYHKQPLHELMASKNIMLFGPCVVVCCSDTCGCVVE